MIVVRDHGNIALFEREGHIRNFTKDISRIPKPRLAAAKTGSVT